MDLAGTRSRRDDVVDLVAAAALAPWTHPLSFRPLSGWRTGASGNVPSLYGGRPAENPRASAAWVARGVRYRNRPVADPPNETLAHLPPHGLIVWAVIYEPADARAPPFRLDLRGARHLRCCEGAYVAGGMDELFGVGPDRKYSVIVRVYYGSFPNRRLRTDAQRALDRLRLPKPR